MTFTYALTGPIAPSLDEAMAVVGGKAANLAVMARDLGLPVPPGFVITTAACRTFLADGWPAVTVQAMVFGNRGATSATGVLFTRNPATGEPRLYGDVLFDAQGEDVVAGTHQTEPIAALDERMPAVAADLRDDASRLERHYA